MIRVRDLSKEFKVRKPQKGIQGWIHPQYQIIRAVDGIDIDVEKGEMVGYIGPNGAGKSTTMKLLTSILTPTEGTIRINGEAPDSDRKRFVQNIGAMFGQKTQLWWDLPLEDSFLLLKDMYNVPEDVKRGICSYSVMYWSWIGSCISRCGSCHWDSACAAIWQRCCCTIPR